MRITDKVMNNTFISNVNSTVDRLYQTQMEITTGRRVNEPSDDPVDAMTSMTIRTRLNDLEQYQRNISQAEAGLSNAETAIEELVEIFQDLSTLAVQGASDSYDESDKAAIAGEVNQLLEQLVSLANSRSESVYVFAGSDNDIAPYVAERDESGNITSVRTTGSSGDIMSLIGENVSIKTNVNGEDVFDGSVNLFDVAIGLRDNLLENDTDAISESLNDITNGSEQIYNNQSVIGARLNRISAAENRAENDVITYTSLLSDAEDADTTEAILDYQTQLTTLQASYQVASMITQMKLVDFLA